MAKLFGELLFGLLRILIDDLIKQAAPKVDAWLNAKIHGRTAKLVLGGFLGLAAFFLYPVLLGVLSALF